MTDASGGTSAEAHERGVQRMVQAGVVPTTTQAVLGELQRDWAREKTLPGVTDISILHAGSFGTSLDWELHLLGSTD